MKMFTFDSSSMILEKICKITFDNRKVWLDLPPSATVPVYKNKVYAKVLRLPKDVRVNFKNDEYYAKTARTTKPSEPVVNQAKFNSSDGNKDLLKEHSVKEDLLKSTHERKSSSNNIKEAPKTKVEKAPEFNINNVDIDNIISHIKDEPKVVTNTQKNTGGSAPFDAYELLNMGGNSAKQEEKPQSTGNANDIWSSIMFETSNTTNKPSSGTGTPKPHSSHSVGHSVGHSNPSGI
jgi:hypothetical protein